jgi:TRAP-type transport system periplasmic protein
MDKVLAQSLDEHGFVTFGFSDGGFAYILSNVPSRRVDDLKSQKVWIPEGDDISRAFFETLGVSPIPLPLTDVLTGLQTGLVTTIAASPVGAIALQWHARVKYLTDIPAVYLYGALAIDKKAYARLTPADQKVVREAMEHVFMTLNHQARVDERGALDALKKQHIEFVTLAPEEVAKLHAAASQTTEKLGGQKVFSVPMLRTVQGHLDTYRRSHPATR